VTRFKSNTRLTVVAENRVSNDGPILSDRIGYLAASRTNPFEVPVHEIRVRIESGKILRILSNDIDASADEIATLYRRRWQIELFFRWIKQTLPRHVGKRRAHSDRGRPHRLSAPAPRLCRTDRRRGPPRLHPSRPRANLMHQRPIDRLLNPPPPIIKDQRQLIPTLCQS
jgi:hypothetical protein